MHITFDIVACIEMAVYTLKFGLFFFEIRVIKVSIGPFLGQFGRKKVFMAGYA